MIYIKNLVKKYGTQLAVNDISFEAKDGEIVGFLGPNGAGKSTTMKIIAGSLQASSGSIEVAGYNVQSDAIASRKNIGYLPEHNPLYLDMYIREFLYFSGGFYNLKGSLLKKRTEEVIDLVGLNLEVNKKIGQLSKGYRQRVGLAQALIHDPKVLILDEPTTGLDPNQLVEIRGVIKKISHTKTILLSTHIMQEVEAVCDRVVLINKGKIVVDSTLAAIQTKGDTLESIFTSLLD